MEGHEVSAESVDLLKLQRHDFVNHLQVIHALIQLGRTAKAMTYIEDLSKDGRLISDAVAMYETQCIGSKKA